MFRKKNTHLCYKIYRVHFRPKSAGRKRFSDQSDHRCPNGRHFIFVNFFKMVTWTVCQKWSGFWCFVGITYSATFYPTALKSCWAIVFTHGVRMGGRQEKVCPGCISETGRQVPIFSYYFLFFNKFLFIPIFQESSYFFLFLVMIMYFKSLNVVDHMEND